MPLSPDIAFILRVIVGRNGFFTVSFPLSERSFWPAFQKRWAALLCEQTVGLGAWSEAMRRALRRGIIEVPNSADAHAALDQLNARLLRLESARQSSSAASLVDETTRVHFVRYGVALLNPPFAAALELDYGMLRLLVNELCDWLQLLKLVPRQVFLLEDFDSQIIGRAIALQLGASFEIVNGDSYTRSKSLIVSADGRNLTAPPLNVVFPGQVLYAFNSSRETGSIAPDVASLTQAEFVVPWQSQRLSSRKIASLVERITGAPLRQSQSHWPARLEFYRARRALLTAGNSIFHRAPMLPETL